MSSNLWVIYRTWSEPTRGNPFGELHDVAVPLSEIFGAIPTPAVRGIQRIDCMTREELDEKYPNMLRFEAYRSAYGSDNVGVSA